MRAVAATLLVLAGGTPALADPTGGVDAALSRPAYDTSGILDVEGARPMAARDIAFAVVAGYAHAPISGAVPGIGDASSDRILDHLGTFDLVFGMALSDRFTIGFDAGAYRTTTGSGYGVRGRYAGGGTIATPSTGLISLRPLSNLDPSATTPNAALGDELAGPLDARVGAKYAFVVTERAAIAAVVSLILPFGADDMLLGDPGVSLEPVLAGEQRLGDLTLLYNAGARFRHRAVVEAYDAMDPASSTADAKVVLDVGSELVAGVAAQYGRGRVRFLAGVHATVPLPDQLAFGACRRFDGEPCAGLTDADYVAGARRGDPSARAMAGLSVHVSAELTATVSAGFGLGGARADQLAITTGLVWSPQPGGGATGARGDRDGDGLSDAIDACPDDREDKDAFEDEDGCPEPDNDGDGIPDAKDRCPNQAEDKDGFEDEDGCPEPDNDGDGIPDAIDRCPNQAEDKDGFEDEDGCPEDGSG